jgi:uncharacterized membrane protein YedE/YeeE
MKGLAALFCGTLFGIGLAMSGMTDTAKVLGFLDLFGDWVPDLMFVMGGAVCVTLVAFRFILKRDRALLGDVMSLPSKSAIDGKLLAGAAIFGIGWGVYGYCPGPAISALGYLETNTVIFVITMLVGMAMANLVDKA